MSTKHLIWLILVIQALVTAQEPTPSNPGQAASDHKITAREAYAMWQADPAAVKILDVRTPEEYIFVGHAPMARNIPGWSFERRWDAEKNKPAMRANPNFVTAAKAQFGRDDPLLVMCRSGTRSVKAVEILKQAGFTKVYDVIDGFEGELVKDPDRPQFGRRTLNGWKNADLPWTYSLVPALMDLEVDQATPSAQAETIAVLGEALDDEYRALATYRAVIAKFGEIRPFSNIVEAEERHAQRLIGLFETQGQVPPADAWKDKVEAPASLEEALKTAVSAEVFNIEMYDRLLKRTQEETVVAALQQLQSASRRHLQAFRRHLNRRQ